MPKFITTFGKKDRMPFLVVLYHSEKPHLNHVGFTDSDPFLMFVDINNYEISEIAERASLYLESRKQAET